MAAKPMVLTLAWALVVLSSALPAGVHWRGVGQSPSSALFSLIASLFFDVRIYEYPNNGFFYDLGFIIGVLAFYGSGSKTYHYTYTARRG